ncbi:Stimulated by retinoic acid gene 6 protein-like [Exaiptasia diaphana]|nr:Stimulated by retinoic acid gene 6 protein-like [Exaiptasia diaphana]
MQLKWSLIVTMHFGLEMHNAAFSIQPFLKSLYNNSIGCIVDAVLIIACLLPGKQADGISYIIFYYLPSVVCTILLLGAYTIFLYQEMRKIYANDTHPTWREIFMINGEREETVAEDIDRIHVSLLLTNNLHKKRAQVEYEPWYVTARRRIYETRPDFKFSTQFLSAVIVSFIFIYQLAVIFTYGLLLYKKNLPNPSLKLVIDYILVAITAASLIATLQLLFFIKSHRSDVLKTYRTRAGQLPDERTNPKMLVGKSLRFCGYQIAFTAIGMIFVAISILFLLSPILVFKLIDDEGRTMLLEQVKETVLSALLPFVTVSLLSWLALFLLCTFVFRDRTYPDLTVTIDNRRLFDIMSYFFFFLNILVGIWSGLSRAAKGAALGLVFLCRLDRTSMMTGYRKWDRGYVAYIGFLNVLVAFRHPVMLCFCQVLIDDRKKVHSGLATRDRPRRSTRALNRWFLAVLLNRNPSLLRYRKRDVFGSRNTYSSATAADTSAVVLEEWEMPSEKLKSTQFY